MKRTGLLLALAMFALICFASQDAWSIHVYHGPKEVNGKVIQVFSGNSFAVFDGEKTVVVVLEGVDTPRRNEKHFLRSSTFLHDLIYGQNVRVKYTRVGKSLSFAEVFTKEGININKTVLKQDYAEAIDMYAGRELSYSVRGNTFRSASSDFSISKSDKWVFLSVEDIVESRKGIRLDDRALEQEIKKRLDTPMLVIGRYPEPYEGFNPRVILMAKTVGGVLGKPPVDLLEQALPDLKKTYEDMKIISPPQEVVVDEIPGAYVRVSYTVSATDFTAYKTMTDIYLIPRGTVMFMLSFQSSMGEFNQYTVDFTEMFNSIEIGQ